MEGNAGGWGAVELPNIAPPLGSVLQSAIVRKDRNDEKRYEIDRENERQDAIEKRRQDTIHGNNVQYLDQLPKQFNSKNLDINAVANKYLQDHRAEAERYAMSHGEGETRSYINSMLAPLTKWHANATTAYDNGIKDLQSYLAKNPHINQQDAKDHFNNLYSKDFFKDDGTGKLTYNPDAQPGDYIGKIDSPAIMKHMRISGDAVDHFIKNIPTDTYDQNLSVNNKGHLYSKDITFKKTPFSMEPFIGADGKAQTGLVAKVVNGQKEITPDMENYLGSHKPMMDYLTSGFEKFKDGLAQKGTPLHPANEGDMFRKYAYDQLSTIWPHDVKEKIRTAEPKPPVVRVNVNNAANAPAVNDVYSQIEQQSQNYTHGIPLNELPVSSQQAVLEEARAITGKTKLSNKNIFIGKDENGQLHIADARTGQSISPLTRISTNLTANKSMGIKTKQKIVKDAQQVSPKKSVKSKGNPLGLDLP